MDNLQIDPDVLIATAGIIEGYCARQQEIMNEYLSNVSSLASEWTDEKTLGTLLEEIRVLKSNVTTLMDDIKTTYPAYFRAKAEAINSRPEF